MNNVQLAGKEIEKVLKKYNLKLNYSITFPIYRQLPEEVKLALLILAKHNMKISFFLSDLK